MGSFRLRQPGGGSTLRGGDSLQSVVGSGVIITPTLVVAQGSGLDASPTSGFGRLITPTGPALGVGNGFAATIGTGTGVFISLSAPALGTGSGLAATIGKVVQATLATGVGSGLNAKVEEHLIPTVAVGLGSGFPATITAIGPPPPPTTLWEVRIYDLNATSPRLTFAPVADWGFGYVLNAPGSFEASIPLTNPAATEANFKAGQREIKVFRNDVLVWGGYLWQVNVPLGDAEQKIRVVGEGYYSRLRRRFVMGDLIYESPGLPQEQIAWNLVKHTQNQSPRIAGQPGGPPWGELGITEGSNSYTTVRERDYCWAQHPNIADSIDELTQMDDGFDFCITPTPSRAADKVFRTFSPRMGTSSGVTLNGQNTMTLDYDIDASDVVTRLNTIGSGDCNPPDDDRTNQTQIQNFGLLQDVLSVQFSNLADVQAHAKEEIRNRNTARWQGQATFAENDGPAWGSVDIGDTLKATANKGYANFNQDFRVLEMNVSLQPGIRQAFTTLTLDSVVA